LKKAVSSSIAPRKSQGDHQGIHISEYVQLPVREPILLPNHRQLNLGNLTERFEYLKRDGRDAASSLRVSQEEYFPGLYVVGSGQLVEQHLTVVEGEKP
jgi:hypothetical protein